MLKRLVVLVAALLATTLAALPAAAQSCVALFDVPDDIRFGFFIGVPDEDVGSAANAGIVQVFLKDDHGVYSRAQTITQEDLGLISEAGDRFGASVMVAELEHTTTHCAELVIGIPGENNSQGRVAVINGTSDGPDFSDVTILRQGADGIPGTPEAGDRFGEQMVIAGRLQHSDSLAIAAPGENVGTVIDAGVVHVLPITDSGLSGGRILQQGSGPTTGTPERGDQFGYSLAATEDYLAIGVPFEDVEGRSNAGLVHTYSRTGKTQFHVVHQDSVGVPGLLENGDRFGWTLASMPDCSDGDFGLAIGSPGENVGDLVDAGSVTLYSGFDPIESKLLTQDTQYVPGRAEVGDEFGYALRGQVVGTLAIGSPGEAVNGEPDAGMASFIPFECGFFGNIRYAFVSYLHQDSEWRNGEDTMAGVAEAGDRFGSSFAVADTDHPRVLIGVPGEDLGAVSNAGMVSMGRYDTGRFYPTTEYLSQELDWVPGEAEAGDGFGSIMYP